MRNHRPRCCPRLGGEGLRLVGDRGGRISPWGCVNPLHLSSVRPNRGRAGIQTESIAKGFSAGCNFSALSGSDPNALKWDRLGYAHLARLADSVSKEAFVSRTESFEYWDENVPHDKIKNMSEYLQDVRPHGFESGVALLTFPSSGFCPRTNFPRAPDSESASPP